MPIFLQLRIADIGAPATELAAVYRITAGASTLGLPVDTSAVGAPTTEADA